MDFVRADGQTPARRLLDWTVNGDVNKTLEACVCVSACLCLCLCLCLLVSACACLLSHSVLQCIPARDAL